MSTRKKHQCHSCQTLMKGHKRGLDGTFICPTNFPLSSTSRVAPMHCPRQGTAMFRKMTSPIRRGMTIELDERGDQVLIDGHRYSRIMPGTLDSQVWTWPNGGGASRQSTPGVVVIDDDDDYINITDDEDDEEVEYEGEMPRLSTHPPSLLQRISSPSRTPAPFTYRPSAARDLGKRRQTNQEREMSIISAAGEDWPLASLYRIPSDRVNQVVREASNHGLHARVIPRSRVVPVPVENNLPWIKEEYEEEDSGYYEGYGEGGPGRMLNRNGNVGGGRTGKKRERERDWEVILGTDEGAVEQLQQIVLNDQEKERQRESRRAISYHHSPSAANNPPPPPPQTMPAPAPFAVAPSPQTGTIWSSVSNILMAMLIGAFAMYYILLQIPDD